MAESGSEVKVYALLGSDGDTAPTTVGAMTLVCGVESFGLERSRINLDKTSFCSDNVRQYFLGLKEGSSSLDGHFKPTGAGQQVFEDAYEGASDAIVWICVAWTGDISDGTKIFQNTITNVNQSAEVTGRVEWSVSLNVSGPVTAGPTT